MSCVRARAWVRTTGGGARERWEWGATVLPFCLLKCEYQYACGNHSNRQPTSLSSGSSLGSRWGVRVACGQATAPPSTMPQGTRHALCPGPHAPWAWLALGSRHTARTQIRLSSIVKPPYARASKRRGCAGLPRQQLMMSTTSGTRSYVSAAPPGTQLCAASSARCPCRLTAAVDAVVDRQAPR